MNEFETREISVRAADAEKIDTAERSIPVIAATENPVSMPDFERMEMVPEVLLMSGAELPADGVVPLLDSHQRASLRDQLGSAKLRADGNQMVGNASFSVTAEQEFTKVKEKHVRSLSIGYKVNEKTYVPRGETKRIEGRDFKGPVNVVSKWKVRELSVLPIGADEHAKMRGLPVDCFGKKETSPMLTKELRDKLIARGMPADLDDAKAVEWSVVNPLKDEKREEPKEKSGSPLPGEKPDEMVKRLAAEINAEAKRQQAAFLEEVRHLGMIGGFDDAQIRTVSEKATDIKTAGEEFIKLRAELSKKNPVPFAPIPHGPAQRDKHAGCLGTALNIRALQESGLAGSVVERDKFIDKHLPKERRQEGWETIRHWGPMRIAEECLRMEGIDTTYMDKTEIAQRAVMQGPSNGFNARTSTDMAFRAGEPGYHTTGHFPKLTLDAMYMSLRAGYGEFPSTWQIPFAVGEPFADFKPMHVVQLGEFPNLDEWTGNSTPNQISVADAEETYKASVFSNMISYNWMLLINDSMSALSRTPAMWGNSAARSLNAHVWNVVSTNPLMQDGVALFSDISGVRLTDNIGTSGAISETTLGEARELMRKQKGLNDPDGNASAAILNIEPRYLVVPANRETTAKKVVQSEFEVTANTYMNINQFRGLQVVVEPILADTVWYLFASPQQIPTIVCSFLRGFESPQVRQWRDDATLAINFAILHAYKAKALDWRGVFRNAGT